MNIHPYSTWLEIDLSAIRDNVNRIAEIAGTPVMAVVKANGYGHGALAVARAAVQAGAAWCGVARIEEALRLREGGIHARLLVLGYTPPARLPEAIANDITLTVYDTAVTTDYAAAAVTAGGTVRLHIKVDTGMGRLGLPPEDVPAFFAEFQNMRGVEIEGVYTHFARGDEPEEAATPRQIARFKVLLTSLDAAGLRPSIVHAANSAGALFFPEARFDLVRAGIALYGLDPAPEARLPSGFRPALSWKARLASKKLLPAGQGISYGHAYHTQAEEWIGVVPVGYADGFRRVSGNAVILAGRRVPVVGRVTMDQAMVRLDDVPQAEIGSEVVIIGGQGGAAITAGDLAEMWGTISYEVVCGLAERLPRIYIDGDEQ